MHLARSTVLDEKWPLDFVERQAHKRQLAGSDVLDVADGDARHPRVEEGP
jgi:hypothetical protein